MRTKGQVEGANDEECVRVEVGVVDGVGDDAVAAELRRLVSLHSGGDIGSSPAIGGDGTIYVGSTDHSLYAVEPSPTGAILWSFETDGMIGASPAIGDGGEVYVGSFDSRLYAVDVDGGFLWWPDGRETDPKPGE